MTSEPLVYTLDLHFQGFPGAIASYLIPHPGGAALVECGPGSTIPALTEELRTHGYAPKDVTHLLLTHIHLDHAGASGWLARQGAQIYVHPKGAPHLVNPEKLLASAQRIYGQMMDSLWGEFLPVPDDHLHLLPDGAEVKIGELCFRTLDTPGHAVHHNAYLLDHLCFSGDIGGIRLRQQRYLRLPMPPPDLNFDLWQSSLERLQKEKPLRIAPIHFGIFEDAAWHLEAALQVLEDTRGWMERIMPKNPSTDQLRQAYMTWTQEQARAAGLPEATAATYEVTNPAFMSADGIMRYWTKNRLAAA